MTILAILDACVHEVFDDGPLHKVLNWVPDYDGAVMYEVYPSIPDTMAAVYELRRRGWAFKERHETACGWTHPGLADLYDLLGACRVEVRG